MGRTHVRWGAVPAAVMIVGLATCVGVLVVNVSRRPMDLGRLIQPNKRSRTHLSHVPQPRPGLHTAGYPAPPLPHPTPASAACLTPGKQGMQLDITHLPPITHAPAAALAFMPVPRAPLGPDYFRYWVDYQALSSPDSAALSERALTALGGRCMGGPAKCDPITAQVRGGRWQRLCPIAGRTGGAAAQGGGGW